jgi:hypothetical protein
VADEQPLIIQVPRGSEVERRVRAQAAQAGAGRSIVVEAQPSDEQGNLEAPAAGQVVLSVLSPEALKREADEVERVIREAGTGVEPLVVEVEAAEELRADELAALLDATRHTTRAVILRVLRDA